MYENPSKPLKILTLDGGGVQGLATLLILDKLLKTIQEVNQTEHKPRPCDVFDTIAGIGAGGWLAILLGRFRLDITACLLEWYNLTQAVMPRSRTKGYRQRLFHKSYFDMQSLENEVERLTRLYGTGSSLFDGSNEQQSVRCKYVFVAALSADSKYKKLNFQGWSSARDTENLRHDYNLFRSYECPGNTKLRRGPKDPKQYKITNAFCVTGAARYFSGPWKEDMTSNGKVSFLDNIFPKPHNITELALDEMWGMFGRDVPISVVVNIGPGMPHQSDVKALARRFSWGLGTKSSPSSHTPSRTAKFPPARLNDIELDINGPGEARSKAIRWRGRESSPDSIDSDRLAPVRTTTFFSVAGVYFDEKLKRTEEDIEGDIRKKLRNAYLDETKRYFRLAPKQSPPRTLYNDISQAEVVLDHVTEHLSQQPVAVELTTASELAAAG